VVTLISCTDRHLVSFTSEATFVTNERNSSYHPVPNPTDILYHLARLNPRKRSQTTHGRARPKVVFGPHAATSSFPAPSPQSATSVVPPPLLPSPNPVYEMRSITALPDLLALWQSSYTVCIVHRVRHSPATARPTCIDASLVTIDAHTLCRTGYALEPRPVPSSL
jgi:hypothetical protein